MFLKRPCALAEVVRRQQRRLSLALPSQCAFAFGPRRRVDRLLGLPQRHRRTRLQRSQHLVDLGVERLGGVHRGHQAQSLASEAEIRSASSAIRIARIRPTAAANSADPTTVGHQPILVNASTSPTAENAICEAITTSLANATTATTGLGTATMARTARLAASSTALIPISAFFV